jgi:hypothetical protein
MTAQNIIDKLTGNASGSLDTFLLNSINYTQEEREIIMEAVSEWLETLNFKT